MSACLLCFTLFLTAGDVAQDRFAAANDHYLSGRFQEAEAEYQRLLDLGLVHEDLLYNLGNARLMQGEIGPGVAAYEKALLLAPDDREIAENLQRAREQGGALPAGASALDLLDLLPTARSSTIFFVAYYLTFVLWLARWWLRRQGRDAAGRRAGMLAVPMLCATLLLGGYLGAQVTIEETRPRAVVLADKAPVREGPDERFDAQLTVPAGQAVRVLHRVPEQGFAEVSLPNGVRGWMRDDDLELVQLPVMR